MNRFVKFFWARESLSIMLIKSSILILRIEKKEDFKEGAMRQATNILTHYEDKTQFVQNGKRGYCKLRFKDFTIT